MMVRLIPVSKTVLSMMMKLAKSTVLEKTNRLVIKIPLYWIQYILEERDF